MVPGRTGRRPIFREPFAKKWEKVRGAKWARQLMQQTMAVAWAHKMLPKNPRGPIHEKVEAAKSVATKRRRKGRNEKEFE